MPTFSYTNQINNGDSLDASKVMQNFNDVRTLLVTTKLDADNIANSAITDTQIASGANITSTKIALADAKILVGNGSGVAAQVTPSGDWTITNAGVATIATGAITSAKILDGTIVNADINSSAAIAYSKLALTGSVVAGDMSLANGKIVVGNGSNVGAEVTPSGDVTMSNTGVTAIGTNKVLGNMLATSAITLGYAEITSNFSWNTTSATQITGLSTTVTIPDGGRRIEIEGFIPYISDSGNSIPTLTIWDGTVGSGTLLSQARSVQEATNRNDFLMVKAYVTPAAGSKTYNLGIHRQAGSSTGAVNAGSTYPAYIIVKAV